MFLPAVVTSGRIALMLVRLQRLGPRQFIQQLLGLVDQNGQALRTDVSGAVAMRQTQQRHFLRSSVTADAMSSLWIK
jgi:hypothetical protein